MLQQVTLPPRGFSVQAPLYSNRREYKGEGIGKTFVAAAGVIHHGISHNRWCIFAFCPDFAGAL